MKSSCPLVLGTAQFGSFYGIANKTGQPEQIAANAIIREAWENGISEFDTAQGYGTSEEVLGKALFELRITKEARIISKFDPSLNHLNAIALSNALDESLRRLRVPYLFCMMLHREEMLTLWYKGLAKILHDFVLSGRIKHIGISVYSPDKAIQALNTEGIDMVQLPTNILDRRFEKAGIFQLANEERKKIYIRSVFLQGLLFMDIKEIPEKMVFTKPVLKKLESLSRDTGLTRLEIALGYLKAEMPKAKLLFGADTPQHVKQNLACWERGLSPSSVYRVKKLFDYVEERVLNSVLWSD
jgi:aryl-alcohol dehydrogenase-like predicted oxidoreductase